MPKFKPEIIYERGEYLIPSKALEYKKDPKTGKVIEKTPPKGIGEFDRMIKKDLGERLIGVKRFPTRKEVFVSISHKIHSSQSYKRCDLDNKAKAVLDALKDIVYTDDAQVKFLWNDKILDNKQQSSSFRLSIKILNKKNETELFEIIKNVAGKSR